MPSVDDISNRILVDEKATVAFGGELHDVIRRLCGESAVVYLHGDLGAGKTTLVRGILRLMNHGGAVKSPTYTLVEPDELADLKVFHFDLYRLADPEELEFIGIRDYVEPGAVCIVEWPDRGADLIPSPDLSLTLEKDGKGRKITMMGRSPAGQTMLGELTKI